MKFNQMDFGYVKRLKQKRLPLIADFELTERCNLKCVHCCVRSDRNSCKQKELSTEEVCDIVSQIREAGVIYLNLTGGEPLFRPDFKDIYLFAKKKFFAVTVITNGTLITEDIIKLFKRYPPLMLEISSYGITQNTYDSVTRTPGSFAMFQKALDMLKGSGIRFITRAVIIKENYDEIMRKYKTIKASWTRCSIALPLILRRDRDRFKNEVIKKQRLNIKEIVNFFKKFPESSIMARERNYLYYRYVDACNCETLACTILPDGTFTMCHLVTRSDFNLKDISFLKAWSNSIEEETLSSKQDIACGDCKYKPYCKWCPGIAYLETGNAKERIPYLCQVMGIMHKKGGR